MLGTLPPVSGAWHPRRYSCCSQTDALLKLHRRETVLKCCMSERMNARNELYGVEPLVMYILLCLLKRTMGGYGTTVNSSCFSSYENMKCNEICVLRTQLLFRPFRILWLSKRFASVLEVNLKQQKCRVISNTRLFNMNQ